MCQRAVEKYPRVLEFVSDWFVMQGQLKLLHEYDYYFSNNDLIKWHNDYQKRKTQKTQIDKCLLSGMHQDGGIGVFLRTRKKR